MIFDRYIGIDYSGAQTAESSLPGLRLYLAEQSHAPGEVQPPVSPRRYWTRAGIAAWLEERLLESPISMVGIDHGFSFPLRYFRKYGLAHDWTAFLEDFHRHWPTDELHTYVDFVREGECGNGAARVGDSRWRRLTEEASGRAKSVFHFGVPGSVAKSTHAGLPWLLHLRKRLGTRIHFWPFDGWEPPAGRSVIAEAYPSLWSGAYPREDRTPDQHDAYSIAAWLRQADQHGSLARYLNPELVSDSRKIAEVEGWILGVLAPPELKDIALSTPFPDPSAGRPPK